MKAALYTDQAVLRERITSLDGEIVVLEEPSAANPGTPILSDPQTALKILSEKPDALVMVLSDLPSFEEGSRLLTAGIRGYGNTYIHLRHLEQAVNAILSGNVWLYPEFMQQMIARLTQTSAEPNPEILEQLTDRERETALLIKEGRSNKEIASELGIAQNTVKQHLSHIFEKLGVRDRFALAMLLAG
jgi:DNA-binding NarL/FixJ family response regulator